MATLSRLHGAALEQLLPCCTVTGASWQLTSGTTCPASSPCVDLTLPLPWGALHLGNGTPKRSSCCVLAHAHGGKGRCCRVLALLKSAVAALPEASAEDDVVLQRIQVIAAGPCGRRHLGRQTACSAPGASTAAQRRRALLGTLCSSSEQCTAKSTDRRDEDCFADSTLAGAALAAEGVQLHLEPLINLYNVVC